MSRSCAPCSSCWAAARSGAAGDAGLGRAGQSCSGRSLQADAARAHRSHGHVWPAELLGSAAAAGRRDPRLALKLDALKAFSESLAPYNTVGKLKNLRIGSDDIARRRRTSKSWRRSRECWSSSVSSGHTAGYLSQAEMVLASDHPWVKQAQAARKEVLDKLASRPDATACGRVPADAGQAEEGLPHRLRRAAQQGASGRRRGQDQVRAAQGSAAGRDARAGGHLADAHQPAHAFEDKLDKLKSCASLVESELAASPSARTAASGRPTSKATACPRPTCSSSSMMSWTGFSTAGSRRCSTTSTTRSSRRTSIC
jgi:hypothetical protein